MSNNQKKNFMYKRLSGYFILERNLKTKKTKKKKNPRNEQKL